MIYDAAHAFGVNCHCGSLLQHGDLSVLSFHATKVFSTFEGGAIVSPDAKTKKRIDRLKNFGFVDELTVAANGINAKMSELHAAVGLAQLPCFESVVSLRRKVAERYIAELQDLKCLILPSYQHALSHNYAYFPVRITNLASCRRDQLVDFLRSKGVVPRRYFHPLIPQFQYYRANASAISGNYPLAKQVASEVLCLPIYPELTADHVARICRIIRDLLA